MNPVLILTRNNLELTKRCVESVFKQRIGNVSIHVLDNGSEDGTAEWSKEVGILMERMPFNYGVSCGWNIGLKHLFNDGAEHVLVIGQDTILPEWFYAELLSYEVPFVTGVGVDDMKAINKPAERMELTPNPDYSAFLISRHAWYAIGPFNDKFFNYCGDCDHHLRGHGLGVGMWKANVPYYHERSSTLRNASPQEQAVLNAQAEADRGQFRRIYGCVPGDSNYPLLFR